MFVELRGGRTHPDHHARQFGRDDHILTAKQEGGHKRRVDLTASRQEENLVAQAGRGEQAQDRPRLPGRQQADRGAQRGIGPGAIREQRDHQHHQQRRIEHDIERFAVVSRGQRHPARPGRQPDGVGPQPVDDRPHRREEAVIERTEAAAEANHFEQHGEEHDLLENDRLAPPLTDVAHTVDALGGQREKHPEEDVETDLDDVEEVQCHRRAKAHLGPMPGHRPDLLRAGALAPLVEIDDRHFLLEKTHGGKTRARVAARPEARARVAARPEPRAVSRCSRRHRSPSRRRAR